MSEAVIVALLALMGTLGGSFLGVFTSAKLTNYRIEQLEKKVEKHNGVIERVFKIEGQIKELEHFHEGQTN